ncbi:hypothetical protein BaRGS_00016505, partial [Batillaria attramentaria]
AKAAAERTRGFPRLANQSKAIDSSERRTEERKTAMVDSLEDVGETCIGTLSQRVVTERTSSIWNRPAVLGMEVIRRQKQEQGNTGQKSTNGNRSLTV